MQIKVIATSIDADTIRNVIHLLQRISKRYRRHSTNIHSIPEYYNANKPADEEPLERLNRAEGGFQIQIANKKNDICDPNQRIRQLRWSRGRLVSGEYIGFTQKQEAMLYEALVHALGGNVLMEL